MSKKHKYHVSKKAGLSPGSLVHIGEKRIKEARVFITTYEADNYTKKQVKTLNELHTKMNTSVNWIEIEGLHDVALMENIGRLFNIDALALEDIMNTEQRPKSDDLSHHLLFILKMPFYNEEGIIEMEQVSLILGRHYVISFKESDKQYFTPIENRIKNATGRLRTKGSDYLFYALSDVIVDNYFSFIENASNALEDMEEKLLTTPEAVEILDIQKEKKEVLKMYKAAFPLRDAVKSLSEVESLIEPSNKSYFDDLSDHVYQIVESSEWLIDMCSEQKELYLSNISFKMNEVMKTLTIIATLFIPLTFVVGVYGMNFANMPELQWKYGYFAVWGIMIAMSIGLMYYFRRKRWL